MKILLIEDEPVVVRMIARYLADAGHSVASAGNAEEGIERLQVERPDFVLLDVELPGMRGLEAIQLIKERCNSPIFVISGYVDDELRRDAVSLGARGVFARALIFRKLRAALQSASRPPSS